MSKQNKNITCYSCRAKIVLMVSALLLGSSFGALFGVLAVYILKALEVL